ncbi:MAG: bifunctional UDP-N-acetylglucosamine diphosphorylase/glucosamine-1-phosphate N-acetyltransferase GlmU [Thermodesulfobacteriota bacterium]|nr:MAG: UDP-N-acetylglucosamine diphosphorylase/glucosamine-1-phosphate N-acetyltransferase [Candidatus Dadabacteria bacterium]|tara:strand:+ start:90727 stop:92106 length:1380 start_codon:yes stop_codon:yes gene_type:complete
MTSKINIVLLCAGKSSRLKFNLPKVILPINGKTLLQRSLYSLGKLSPSKTIIVAGFKKELVINLSKTLNYKNLKFVVQKEQLGTGDAVKKAASSLDDKSIALIMNGDTPFVDEETINQALSQYRKTKSVFTIATTKPSSPFGYGRILRDNDGQILDIVEEKDCNNEQKLIKEVNAGLYLIATDYLKKFVKKIKKNKNSEYYLTDLVNIFVTNGLRVDSVPIKDERKFININTFDDYREAHNLDKMFIYEECVKQNIFLSDPESFQKDLDVKISKNVFIGPNVILKGNTELKEGVRIEGSAFIANSLIGKGTLVKPFTTIEDSSIGSDVQIGPFSNLRPGNTIDNNAKIGNFVEIKKSKIGNKSKVPHLSYIGDTEMGSMVNIGAGTITCNYDGFTKHKTNIDDNVFIGSDTMLIAPIKVGKGSTTAAGSILNSNIPSQTLAVTRVKEKHIPNWKRKPKK